MRALTIALVLASCGGHDEKQVVQTADSDPRRVRTDRRELRIEEPGWHQRGIVGVSFCPGDRELVTVDHNGWLRRWAVADGAAISTTPLTAREPRQLAKRLNLDGSWQSGEPLRVECGPDGSALAIAKLMKGPQSSDARGLLFRVDRDGEKHLAALHQSVAHARFAQDGRIQFMYYSATEVNAWDGTNLEVVHEFRPYFQSFAEGAAFVYRVLDGKADGLYVARGETTYRLEPSTDLGEVHVAPDGSVIATDDRGRAVVWIVTAGKPGKRQVLPSNATISSLAISNEFSVALDTSGKLTIRSREGAIQHVDAGCTDADAPLDRAVTIAMSTSGTRLALVCSGSGLRFVDLATATISGAPAIRTTTDAIAWGPHDELALLGAVDQVRIWRRGELAQLPTSDVRADTLWWQADKVAVPIWSPDAAYRVFASDASADGPRLPFVPTLWRATPRGELVFALRFEPTLEAVSAGVVQNNTFRELAREQYPMFVTSQPILAASLAPDGSRVGLLRYTGPIHAGTELLVIDLAANRATVQPFGATQLVVTRTRIVGATPDGTLLLAAPGQPADTGDPWASAAVEFGAQPIGDHGAGVLALAYSPDGEILAAGGLDGRITLWIDGKLAGTLTGHTAPVRAIAWSLDGGMLASTGDDGTLVWDVHVIERPGAGR